MCYNYSRAAQDLYSRLHSLHLLPYGLAKLIHPPQSQSKTYLPHPLSLISSLFTLRDSQFLGLQVIDFGPMRAKISLWFIQARLLYLSVPLSYSGRLQWQLQPPGYLRGLPQIGLAGGSHVYNKQAGCSAPDNCCLNAK